MNKTIYDTICDQVREKVFDIMYGDNLSLDLYFNTIDNNCLLNVKLKIQDENYNKVFDVIYTQVKTQIRNEMTDE